MADITPATLMSIYRTATTIRQCDERFLAMLTAGEIAITYYSPRGQEVISAGDGGPPDQGRLRCNHLPRAARPHREGRAAAATVGRVPGPRDRHVQGQGRPDAHHAPRHRA